MTLMKTIIVGTANPAKVEKIRHALSGLAVLVKGLEGEVAEKFKVDETGGTAVENARIKALAYSEKIGKPVLSSDSAVYIDGLSEERQPGTRVRRIKGKKEGATDEELLEYFSAIVGRLGGEATSRVEDGICIAKPSGRYYETTIISRRKLTSQPSQGRVKGHPLDSLQIDPKTGKYFSEMTKEEKDKMWERLIGKKLARFVEETLPKL
jgi:inosine/xanthosine triphosphate pyrophosphatase family protein